MRKSSQFALLTFILRTIVVFQCLINATIPSGFICWLASWMLKTNTCKVFLEKTRSRRPRTVVTQFLFQFKNKSSKELIQELCSHGHQLHDPHPFLGNHVKSLLACLGLQNEISSSHWKNLCLYIIYYTHTHRLGDMYLGIYSVANTGKRNKNLLETPRTNVERLGLT